MNDHSDSSVGRMLQILVIVQLVECCRYL